MRDLEKTIRKEYASLDWPKLKAFLERQSLSLEDVQKIVNLTRISESLLFKRAAKERQMERDALLEGLTSLLIDKGFLKQSIEISEIHVLLKRIETYYQGVLSLLRQCSAGSYSAQMRVSALLSRSGKEYLILLKDAEDSFTKKGEGGSLLTGAVNIEVESGRLVNVAAVHTALLDAICSNICMEAHQEGWFDERGFVVIPDLPTATEADEYAVGSVQVLAICWRNLERAERRVRYLGEEFEEHVDNLPPDLVQKNINKLVRVQTSSRAARLDFIANCRLEKRFEELLVSIHSNPARRMEFADLSSLKLRPIGYPTSIWELHGLLALSQLTMRDIVNDSQEFAGLTLAEWVRGFAVLRMLCEVQRDSKDPTALQMRFSKPDLINHLTARALSTSKANDFIDMITFGRKSRDLFDCPLLMIADGSYLLVAIAAVDTLIPKAVLSLLGARGISVEGKGRHFETYIANFLRLNGFEVFNIRRKRLGEEFDFDVAFEWGEYIFLLECKSKSLSSNDPVGAYYFSLEMQSAISQVRRLKRGLEQHPDILIEFFPRAVEKEIVFVIMNAMPYAVPGGIDGIWFTDESSFTRFFSSAHFGGRRIDPLVGFQEIEDSDVIASTWDGSEPTPEDLLRHLSQPIQVVITDAHTSPSPAMAHLGGGALGVFEEFGQVNMTGDSIRACLAKANYHGKAGQ